LVRLLLAVVTTTLVVAWLPWALLLLAVMATTLVVV